MNTCICVYMSKFMQRHTHTHTHTHTHMQVPNFILMVITLNPSYMKQKQLGSNECQLPCSRCLPPTPALTLSSVFSVWFFFASGEARSKLHRELHQPQQPLVTVHPSISFALTTPRWKSLEKHHTLLFRPMTKVACFPRLPLL